MRAQQHHSQSQLRRRGKKSLAALSLAVALAAVPAAAGHASAAAPGYKVLSQSIQYGGQTSTVSAINLDGSTYVGLRVLNDKLGLKTEWNQAAHTATVSGNGRTLSVNVQTGETRLNDQPVYGLEPILQSNSTYLPLRFLLERMGFILSYDAATRGIGIEKIQENALTVGTGTIKESDDKIKMTLEANYPVVSGLADSAVQEKINAFLKSEAETRVAAAKDELKQAGQANADYAKSNPGETLPPVSFESSYYVTYNENGLLSLYVDYYEYTGGAHGFTVRAPYTFDLKTGGALTLKDAAGGNADYVKIINAAIEKQIKARKLELLTPFKTIEADRPFFLNHSGLVIYFEQYEYTPYAYGMPEFTIPLKAFK